MAENKEPRSREARSALKRTMTPYLRNRLQARYPKLADYFKLEDFRWGVLNRIYLSAWDARHHAEALAFLDDPECLLLRTLYVNKMKVDLAELQCEVIDDCLQLFGGYGYTVEYPIAQMFANARVQRIYGGANEIMTELIARSL